MKPKSLLFAIIYLLSAICGLCNGTSWSQILEKESGVVQFYWYPSNKVIENSLDIVDGIEHELAIAFIDYLNRKYEVDIQIEWIETKDFQQVMDTVRMANHGVFGVSSISITPERSKYLNFTKPFLADIAVLVSNNYLPVALTEQELKRVLSDNIAVSIPNTTLSKALNDIKERLDINFDIEYVTNSGEIIETVTNTKKSFGYVDIANFLDVIDQNVDVRRQFFYPVKLEGLAMIYSKNSDWEEPINDYFNSQQFGFDKYKIINKYLGSDASEIIARISKSAEIGPLEEIVISNREKEAQFERLLEAASRDRESEKLTIILTSIIVVAAIVLVLLFLLYRLKSNNNQKLIEQQRLVEDANKKLLALNDDKNNLIKVLAHDLRSPLSNILNGAQIIESAEDLTDQSKTLLGFILQSSEKMSSLIDKILDVDAIETGRHNLKIEIFEMKPILDQLVKENESKSQLKSIDIELKAGKSLKVRADKIYTSQVLDNLISNAIKYSESNSKVSVKARKEGEMVKLSVIDQGPGLTAEDEKKLFRKYQQLSAKPTQGEKSIGLGLSIVKLFTERMGGKISYETKVGKGTSFFVHLPIG